MELSIIDVTTQKQNQLASKGITSVEELVQFLPRKYNDFTRETGILPETEISCLTVTVNKINAYYGKTPMIMAFCNIVPSGESVFIKWFNQSYIKPKLDACVGKNVLVAGKVTKGQGDFSGYSIVSPELFEQNIAAAKGIYPVYSKIEKMGYNYLVSKIKIALSLEIATQEICPRDILDQYHQPSMKEALMKLHNPATMEDVKEGQERILFNDLLYFAICNEWAMSCSAKGSAYGIKTLKGYQAVINSLPYKLTIDQKNATEAMIAHARDGKRINALVQGDVGCGKSIVAFLMMVTMADSGYQSVIMAPTQVLARQHYTDLSALVEPLGYKVAYLGGSEMKKSEKTKLLKGISAGEYQMVVGTHAVIGKAVVYKDLALTITDEEHKFGVEQRAAITEKAAAGVHAITMSATPIPRSLASVLYGENIQLHTIKTMPAGRKPIRTGIGNSKEKLFNFIISEAKKGRQTYVVCPMIDQNEDMDDVFSVEEVQKEYEKALLPNGVKIKTLTGRSTKQETEETIDAFKKGEIHVLIATTVIEVGVNVPTATTMVITNAERFGLSQLHQLRGRVGRGDFQSYCVLVSDTQTEDGKRRLQAMCDTTDGFRIAEEDLKIRGAGDFLGTKQSGDNKYMNLMLANPEKYQTARKIAQTIIDRGPECCLMADKILGESPSAS